MSRTFEITALDGSTETMIEEDGWVVTKSSLEIGIKDGDLKHQLQSVKDMAIREDDVFVATYQKAGTHWIWEIVSMLLCGEAKYEIKSKAETMLEWSRLETIDNTPSPRILNSHLPVHLLPTGVMEKKIKIIHVSRNPKDIVVSLYNMLHKIKGETYALFSSFAKSVHLFTGGTGSYLFHPWPKYVLAWERFTQEHPDQILNLYFEDMKQDLYSEVKKVAEFLGVEADDTLLRTVTDACNFMNMKKANDDVKQDITKTFTTDGSSAIFRKGDVGDWKNWLTVAQNESFDQWVSENLTDTNLRFRYEL